MKIVNKIHQFTTHLFLITALLLLPSLGWSNETNPQRDYSKYAKKEMFNIEGTLEIRAAFFLNNKKGEELQYLLHAKGQSYYLTFTDHAPTNLLTGSVIKLKKGQAVNTGKDLQELLISADDVVIIKKARSLPDAFGSQKTVVLLVNFQDQPSNQPFSVNAVNNMVFGSVSNQYIESSYNQTNFVGNVYGWMTLPINSTTDCNTLTNNIPGLAATAAAQQGIDLSSYIHRVYIFPNTRSCGWAGLGTIGRAGAYSNAWINGYNDLRVIAHELGHNDGIYHSHRLTCPGGGTQGSCSTDEYGDYADTMGWGFGTHFNAYQKERLGWLNYGSSPLIQTVTTTGNYNISPYETMGNNSTTKGLKILRQNLADGSQDYYYVEFRTATGFDAPLGGCGSGCNFTQGVLLHQGNTQNPNSSNAFFPNANTSNPSIIALLPGQSFTDTNAANGGVTITLNSISSGGANISVQFGNNPPPTCTHKAPTLTISPSILQTVFPGDSRTYSVTVTNNDSSTCNPAQFSINTPTSSSYMSASSNSNTLTIAPGNTSPLNVTVGTATNTPHGIYYFSVLAINTTSNYYGGVIGGFGI